GREPSLEILPRTPLHGIPVAVEVKTALPGAMPSTVGPGPVDPTDPAMRERQLQQELAALKQQQQLQKQLLFAEFQKQHAHLTRQHEAQLQKHLQQQQERLAAQRQRDLEQQRQREQQRQEELERQRLEQQLLVLRHKEKSKES
uniref:histone deacetylase n=1 Tax=Chinchilla lanigera TaxID=34839 RepID=A0A8C2W0W2_CHILA